MSLDPAALTAGFTYRSPAPVKGLVSMAACREVRAVHFIDIENLCGVADVQVEQARQAMREYAASVRIAIGDHVIIGSSHHNAIAAGSAWLGARLLDPQSGADGADRALREAMRTENIPGRYNTMYLGSGDGGFSADLVFLASQGVTTHVVARPGSLSAELRISAEHVTMLQPHPTNTTG